MADWGKEDDGSGTVAEKPAAIAPSRTLEDEESGARTDPQNQAEPIDEPLSSQQVVSPENYELGEEFARGGLGRILRARDRRLDRVVALKELKREHPIARARFAREVKVTARLQHPNIIPVHEAGRWPTGGVFYTMKLVDGRTLTDAIDRARTFAERLALLPALEDIADAIAYAHSQGIIHRDLKPANVLVGPFGETVVIDWGLAKELDEKGEPPAAGNETERPSSHETRDGAIVGTPAYMPPEQAAGKALDKTADVYALGAILYHIIAGKSPYAESPQPDVIRRVLAGPPTPLHRLASEAPPDLLAIVDKAMARDPADRYPTAAEMAEELRRFTTGRFVDAYRYTLWDRIRRFVGRHRAAVTTAALAAGALAIFTALSVARIAEERDRAESSARREARAREIAERRVDELLVEKARSLLDHDPTRALAWLKRLGSTPKGAATVATRAEARGVAQRILRGHENLVTTVEFSPDGSFAATAGQDKRVVLWNLSNEEHIELSGHRERITRVAFSPSSDVLASASYDGTVRLWNVQGGSPAGILTGHRGAVKDVAFSPDRAHIASIGSDGTARLWSAAGREEKLFRAPMDRDLFVLFSPDGRWLLTGSHGAALALWPVDGKGAEQRLEGHRGAVRGAAFSPDGRKVASVGEDGGLRLWTVGDDDAAVLRQRGAPLYAVAFSPDGGSLAYAGMDGNVALWDLSGGSHQIVATHRERAEHLRFSSDGRFIASAGWDKAVRLYDTQRKTTRALLGHGDVVAAVAFDPEGRRLLSGSWDKTARLWRLDRNGPRALLGHSVGVRSVAFSPSGDQLASAGHDDTVRLWNLQTGTARVFEGHTDHVYRVVFSPDGESVASSSDDRTVRVWSVATGEPVVLAGHTADVEELAFSPDGQLLASAAEDETARLWELDSATGKVLSHDNDVTALAFEPNGERLASASRDGKVRLWKMPDGELLEVLSGHRDEVWAVAFSPDGGLLASASTDDSVIVTSLANGERRAVDGLAGARTLAFSPNSRLLAVAGRAPRLWQCRLEEPACSELEGHRALVRDVAYAPGSDILLTAGGDGTLQIWDPSTQERRVLEGHTAPIFDIATSPDGRLVASASGDATIRVWPVEPPLDPTELKAFLKATTREVLPEDVEALREQ